MEFLKAATSTEPPVAVMELVAVAVVVTLSDTNVMRGLDAIVAVRVAPIRPEPSCRMPPLTATSKNRLLPVYRPVSTVGGSTTSTTSPPVALRPPNAVMLLEALLRIKLPTAEAVSKLAMIVPVVWLMVPAEFNNTVPAFSTALPRTMAPALVDSVSVLVFPGFGPAVTDPAVTVPATASDCPLASVKSFVLVKLPSVPTALMVLPSVTVPAAPLRVDAVRIVVGRIWVTAPLARRSSATVLEPKFEAMLIVLAVGACSVPPTVTAPIRTLVDPMPV